MKKNILLYIGFLSIGLLNDSISAPSQKKQPVRQIIGSFSDDIDLDDGHIASTCLVDWEHNGKLLYKNEVESNVPTRQPSTACQSTTDYLIIGLGTSGAVLARYLSDDFSNSVVVLNQGGSATSDPTINAGVDQQFELGPTLKYDQHYSGASHITDVPNSGGTFYLTESASNGKVWGGGSATNNFFLATWPSTDFNTALVNASGNPRWSFANLLPYYQFIETFVPNFSPIPEIGCPGGVWPVSPERGTDGPLVITQLVDPLCINPNDPYISAFTTITGAPIVNDLSVSSAPTGLSSLQAYSVENPDGSLSRTYAIPAFLPPSILNPDGTSADGRKLRVISPTKVVRLLFNGTKAVGVQYLDPCGNCRQIFANKKIILASGSLGSTKLLLASGIGPTADLTAAGVPVVVNNPNVGTGLKIQYGVMAVIAGELPDYFINLGAMIDGSNSQIPTPLFPHDNKRNYQVFLYPFNALSLGLQSALGIVGLPAFTIAGIILNPASTGTIQLVNKITKQVTYNVYTDDQNKDLLSAVQLYSIFADLAALTTGVIYWPTLDDFGNEQQLIDCAKACLYSDNYCVQLSYIGGAAMGTSSANGVVDGNLSVYGVQNLMIADRSVLPTEVTGDWFWMGYTIGLVAANILGANVP